MIFYVVSMKMKDDCERSPSRTPLRVLVGCGSWPGQEAHPSSTVGKAVSILRSALSANERRVNGTPASGESHIALHHHTLCTNWSL